MAEQEVPKHVAQFLERAAPLEETHPDFRDVVNSPVFTPEMASALYESEDGPKVAYHLGKNPEEANRIAGLPSDQMHREIGRLGGRFSAPGNERAFSEAPDPITPVRGTSGPDEGPSDKDDTATWMKKEQARQLAKRRANPFA